MHAAVALRFEGRRLHPPRDSEPRPGHDITDPMYPTPTTEAVGRTLSETSLLAVTHRYKTFTKEQIEPLASHLGQVNVTVRYNPIAELYEYIPIQRLRPYRKEAIQDTTGMPTNVETTLSSVVWLPLEWSRSRLGDQHYRAVLETIERDGIEFDIVHAHFTWTAGYVGARLKREFDVPFVLTVHENGDLLREEYDSGRKEIARTWESADVIIRVNERDAPLLREFNDDVRTIPNGFSRDRYSLLDPAVARNRLGLPARDSLVFALGGLSERKGFQFLIEAMEEVTAEHDRVHCFIGGEGSYRSTLEERIAERGLDASVTLLGRVPEAELECWMNACDLFVLPSLAEGNPTVMFEALGCGKPFVGTDVGGVSEIIDSDEYGIVCPPADAAALADAVVEGLERSWDRQAILSYGERFTWEQIAERVADVYRDCLDAA
jgi:glycosyltransferase involved in cell wall biosynthesis